MKTLILSIFLVAAGLHEVAGQQILDSLIGKWEVKEVYKKRKSVQPTGVLVFEHDGVFKTVSSYFGTTTGLYRTDETRAVVYIEVDEVTSEWAITLKNNVLRMESVPNRKKDPRIVMVLTEGNQQTSRRTP